MNKNFWLFVYSLIGGLVATAIFSTPFYVIDYAVSGIRTLSNINQVNEDLLRRVIHPFALLQLEDEVDDLLPLNSTGLRGSFKTKPSNDTCPIESAPGYSPTPTSSAPTVSSYSWQDYVTLDSQYNIENGLSFEPSPLGRESDETSTKLDYLGSAIVVVDLRFGVARAEVGDSVTIGGSGDGGNSGSGDGGDVPGVGDNNNGGMHGGGGIGMFSFSFSFWFVYGLFCLVWLIISHVLYIYYRQIIYSSIPKANPGISSLWAWWWAS